MHINLYKPLTNNKVISRLVKATFGSGIIRIIGMMLTFLVGAQLAHFLGVDGYGAYGFAMSATAILTIPTQFGFPQLITREISSAKVGHDWPRIFWLLRWFDLASVKLFLATIIPFILWMLLKNYGVMSSADITLLFGLLSIPLATQVVLKGATLRGLDCILSSQLLDAIIQPALMSSFVFFLVLVSDDKLPQSAMAARGFSLLLTVVVAYFLLNKILPEKENKNLSAVEADSNQLWSSAFPMALTEGMRVLQGNALAIVLGLMSSAASVGVYKIASSTILLISLPLTIVNLTISPMISQAYTNKDFSQLKTIMIFSSLTMSLGVATLSIPFIFYGDTILLYAFGEGFDKSIVPLLIMSLGTFVSSFFGANIVFLNMCRREKIVARAFVFSFLLMLLLAAPLIFYLNEIGAAIAYSIAMIFNSAFLFIKIKKDSYFEF